MYKQLFSLEGKTVVVTGGSGYLGREIAKGLSEFCATVVVADVNDAGLGGIGEDRIHYVRCDVSDTTSIREAFQEANRIGGGIHALVHCATYGAGYGPAGTIENMSDEDWSKGVDGALGTAFRCTRESVPYLEAAGGGSIVHFGSMYGMVSPDPSIYGTSGANNPGNYGAGKAGVIQLTRYCAAHLAPKGIRVNSVSPGPFPNPHYQQDPAFVNELNRKTMLRRTGKAEEIVGAVLLLVSGASSYMTGSNLVVDGGWTAW